MVIIFVYNLQIASLIQKIELSGIFFCIFFIHSCLTPWIWNLWILRANCLVKEKISGYYPTVLSLGNKINREKKTSFRNTSDKIIFNRLERKLYLTWPFQLIFPFLCFMQFVQKYLKIQHLGKKLVYTLKHFII